MRLRSILPQPTNQSWLAALALMMDTSQSDPKLVPAERGWATVAAAAAEPA